jgi:NitT/TauT family transport system substrate-binding protein
MITRRTILKGAAGAAGGLALGLPWLTRPAAAATSVRITQAVTALAFVQNYVAQSQGFFEAEGLDAELVDTRGGGPDVQMVLAGRAEFTTNDGAQVLPALQKGQKLVCVLNLLNRSIINVTMRTAYAEERGITEGSPFAQKVAALEGARIGVTRPGALTWQAARANLINAGMDPDADAQIIGVGGASALAAALENDDIDAMYISVPIGDRVVARGNGITLIDNARGEDPNIPVFMMEGLWVSPDYLASDEETVGKAVRALVKASQFITASTPEAVADAVSHVFGSLDRGVLVQACARVAAAVSRSGVVSEEDLRATESVLRINGFLEREFEVAEVFDGRFIA